MFLSSLLAFSCLAAEDNTRGPFAIAFDGGIEYNLIPLTFPDKHGIWFGETEVTNAMWGAFLCATGGKRIDDVDLTDVGSEAPEGATSEEDRKALAKWRAGQQECPYCGPTLWMPPQEGENTFAAIVRDEDWGMAGFSSVRDRSLLWREGKPPTGKDNLPVTFVTIKDAYAFCRWLSTRAKEGYTIRLPTAAEWVLAAYGGERKYPWGNDRRPIPCGTLYSVKANPELNTPEGLYNMYGNASEFIYTDSDGYGRRVSKDEMPCVTQWMGTDSFRPWDIPRKDYFGYCHLNRIRRDCWGFRVVMVPKEEDANQ